MYLHSNDSTQKTTKLERIGKLAETKKETVFNNLGHALDLDLLRESYQKLDGRKAIGIDGVSKEAYGVKLEDNLQDLLMRIRKGGYKPQASRIVEISKEDGGKRPLAISCLEDKIVQMAVTTILTLIFEPLFLPCSFGFRENKNCHGALRELLKSNDRCPQGATVEIDVRKYFNTIPHSMLEQLLKHKIADKRFLQLIMKLIRAPILVDDKAALNVIGCPQGSVLSPCLANIYLHYVIDEWFNKTVKLHIKGNAEMVRYADDMVFVFQHLDEAKKFYQVLPKRLAKFGLELHMDKSSLIETGSEVARKAEENGQRIPTYKFLGFTCYWGKSRSGKWRIKFKSRSDRFTAKLKSIRKHLKGNQHIECNTMIKAVNRVVKGWVNYHAISDNQRRVSAFLLQVEHTLFDWFNRKGGKRRMTWERFERILKESKFPRNFKTTSLFSPC